MKSGTTGRLSELQAIVKAVKGNYTVCEPVTTESFDLLLCHPSDPQRWIKGQVKTLFYREERDAYVCYATKRDGSRYPIEEVDVFLGVDAKKGHVYVIDNNEKNREYWAKNPMKKWRRLK